MRNSEHSSLFICIYFPEWSIDVTRRELATRSDLCRTPEAIILTTTKNSQIEVARACRTCLRSGIRPGMTLALAKALAPQNCHQEPFNPQRDLRALQTLAAWCLRFTPSVGLDHELRLAHARHELQQLNKLHWGLTLDLTGTEKLHRDLTQLTESLHLAFKGSASVALAPTIGAAWALSRYQTKAASVARSITALNSLVANLPSEALRIDLKTCDALAELGIYTVSDILNLPRQSLSQRFGKQLTYRLAQLTGAIDERVYPISPTKRQQKQRLFEPPLTNRRSITQAIEALFQALIKDLKQAHIAAKLFELIVTDTSSKTTHKNLLLASATNDAKHLESVIQPIIDSISFCGEVKLISIEAKDTIYITHKQSDFYNENSPSSEAIERSYSELINSFSVKIGRDRVLRARLTQSYTPELAFHYCSAADQYQAPQFSPSYDPNQRPTVLFSRPEPITTIALLPDKPPSWIRWRSINLAIISGFGPERIAPEWWHGELGKSLFAERDYFKVQDKAGRWLWVFRDQITQDWFIHGVWT